MRSNSAPRVLRLSSDYQKRFFVLLKDSRGQVPVYFQGVKIAIKELK